MFWTGCRQISATQQCFTLQIQQPAWLLNLVCIQFCAVYTNLFVTNLPRLVLNFVHSYQNIKLSWKDRSYIYVPNVTIILKEVLTQLIFQSTAPSPHWCSMPLTTVLRKQSNLNQRLSSSIAAFQVRTASRIRSQNFMRSLLIKT